MNGNDTINNTILPASVNVDQKTEKQIVHVSNSNPLEIGPPPVNNVVAQIRSYNMNICKQMKNKLMYIDRKNFVIRFDKGSMSKEQVYIECSTGNYEYLKYHLIQILEQKLKCTEDVGRRKVITDNNSNNNKVEVECQYTVKFAFNNVQYSIHITFYYTKCSIWLHGPPTKINNCTIAQFFSIHYLEKVSNMMERFIPLQEVGNELKNRISMFLRNTVDEKSNSVDNIQSNNKCITCKKNCPNKTKSIVCNICNNKQHFNCAGIKDETERTKFLNGRITFLCTQCISKNTTEDRMVLNGSQNRVMNQEESIQEDNSGIKHVQREINSEEVEHADEMSGELPHEHEVSNDKQIETETGDQIIQQDEQQLIEKLEEEKEREVEIQVSEPGIDKQVGSTNSISEEITQNQPRQDEPSTTIEIQAETATEVGFPLIPAYGITINKAQGMTIGEGQDFTHAIIKLNDDLNMEKLILGIAYTAISRVKEDTNFALAQGIPLERLQYVNTHPQMAKRKAEATRLESLAKKTYEKYSCTQEEYINLLREFDIACADGIQDSANI